MNKSKLTEEQITFPPNQHEVGTSVEEVYRKMGISTATFFNRTNKFGGLGPSELRRLKQLEVGRLKLKGAVAGL